MTLPPGVSRRNFSAALRRFAAVVGEEGVFSAADEVALYRDAYSPFWDEEEERVVAAAVAPQTVEQVQEILGIASRFQIPIYPISTGRNLAYGGAAPVMSGSVVLDLKRMNRVLEVSERHAYALVEPGVSYFDLYRHIQDRGLRLMLDVPTPGWGSLIGNALDRGVGLTPMRDHFAAQCGMEVVLADGSVLRTGMGAIPGAETWQQYKYGIGPYIDGLFSQSNFGVVTKMGFWLLPEPELVRGLRVSVPRHDDVVPLLDIVSSLVYSGVIDSQFSISSPVLHGSADAELRALLRSADGGTAEQWDRYALRRDLGFWDATFSFYGPEPIVNARWTHVVERCRGLPGVRFADAPRYRFPMSLEERQRVVDKEALGIPSLANFGGRSASEPKVADGHMDFSVVVPMSGEAVLEALKVFAREFAESGVDVGMGAITSFHARTLTFISSFPILRDDPAANRRMRAAYERAVAVATERGWGQYRTHAAYMDLALAAYAFNDDALSHFHARLKDAVDPNGILAAGRYGIWPGHMR